jgi:cyclophilin family peptidyl-prolyl cis-trans isomerase
LIIDSLFPHYCGILFVIIVDQIQISTSNFIMKKRSSILIAMMLVIGTSFAQEANPIILIKTDFGDIKCELYNETPGHRDNFLELAESGKFNGSIFHRVIKDFMIQGGGDANMGTIDGRPQIPAEILPQFIHKKGALSAARTNNPQKLSSGSQFYIVQGRKTPASQLDQMAARSGVKYTDEHKKTYAELGGTPHLDGGYTVFGAVIEGLDVVDKIAATQTGTIGGVPNKPVKDIKMIVSVVKK